jgi:hypothetical protein
MVVMDQKDELRAIQVQGLRNRMDRGLAEAHRGRGADGEKFMQALVKDLNARKPKRKAR